MLSFRLSGRTLALKRESARAQEIEGVSGERRQEDLCTIPPAARSQVWRVDGVRSRHTFGYKSLPLYWSESNRHPFLIRSHGKLAGLALVKRGSEISDNQEVWDMAEF